MSDDLALVAWSMVSSYLSSGRGDDARAVFDTAISAARQAVEVRRWQLGRSVADRDCDWKALEAILRESQWGTEIPTVVMTKWSVYVHNADGTSTGYTWPEWEAMMREQKS